MTEKEKQEKVAQDLIQVKGLDDGRFITNDNRLVQILKVSAVNTQLMSNNELRILLEKYEAFLKSLIFPIQQEIVSEPVDLKEYIRTQKNN